MGFPTFLAFLSLCLLWFRFRIDIKLAVYDFIRVLLRLWMLAIEIVIHSLSLSLKQQLMALLKRTSSIIIIVDSPSLSFVIFTLDRDLFQFLFRLLVHFHFLFQFPTFIWLLLLSLSSLDRNTTYGFSIQPYYWCSFMFDWRAIDMSALICGPICLRACVG